MRIAGLIARLLLGLIFLVFGLNGFFHFLNMGPMPSGLAGQFLGALFQSHYLVVVAALQVLGGLLLLLNRFVPLGLTLLGPIVVNILLYHLLLNPQGLAIALFTAVLWLIAFARYRSSFQGIFAARAN